MKRWPLLAIVACVIQCAAAENIVLVPSTTWNPDNIPRNPADIQGTWRGGLNAVAWWVNLYGQQSVNDRVAVMLKESITKLSQDLAWTGEGVLLNVRLIRASHPDSPLKAVGILGDQVWYAGTGRTAEEALFDYWRTPQLRPGIPDGWTEDPMGNNYFWVTLDASGRVVSTVVPRGLATELDSRVTANFSQYALEYYRHSWQATDTWQNITRKAKSQLSSRAEKQALDKAYADVRASQERVVAANKKLEKALEDERRTASALQLVQTLQGILTVAQLIQEVRTTMNDLVPELSSASTGAAVVETTSKVLDGKRLERTKFAAAFDGSVSDLQTFLATLGGMVKNAGAPPSAMEKLKVGRKP